MCGRYVSPTQAELERYWDLTDTAIGNPFEQRFNIAPTTQVPIVFIENGAPVIYLARWGLVPIWWKQPKLPPFTFNARIEEAATKPMWRAPLKSSRCLVPAVGWYEWKEGEVIDPQTGEVKKVKQPFFIHFPENKLLHFAGLMSKRHAENDRGYELSCSIMTKEAEGPATDVHTRMPVILPKTAHRAWMDPEQTDAGKVLEIARDVAVRDVEFYPVSTRVNYSKNEGPDLLAPFPNPA